MATCRKCAFAKNTTDADTEGLQTGRPRCMLTVTAAPGNPFRPVQSGDYCGSWTPKSPSIARDALRILDKRLHRRTEAQSQIPDPLRADRSLLACLARTSDALDSTLEPVCEPAPTDATHGGAR